MTLLHIGDHSGISFEALGLHLLEADHLFFMALTLAVGWAAYRYGRKVEARVQVAAKDRRP
jgi:EamA domain-containing membrane protein RarD